VISRMVFDPLVRVQSMCSNDLYSFIFLLLNLIVSLKSTHNSPPLPFLGQCWMACPGILFLYRIGQGCQWICLSQSDNVQIVIHNEVTDTVCLVDQRTTVPDSMFALGQFHLSLY
jgi:hypothetical protein